MIVTLLQEMITYYTGDPKRIQHFIKVHSFAKLIGEMEQLDTTTLQTLEIAAIVHDIGIKVSEEKYGRCNGKLQEQEGPILAKNLLEKLNLDESIIDRVCYLVGHHHTYTVVDGIDYQILIEADFLVNLYEDSLDKQAIKAAYQKIFKTSTGKELCKTMFAI
ncbi:HD domain-containing protein [Anaerosporobacter sp.]